MKKVEQAGNLGKIAPNVVDRCKKHCTLYLKEEFVNNVTSKPDYFMSIMESVENLVDAMRKICKIVAPAYNQDWHDEVFVNDVFSLADPLFKSESFSCKGYRVIAMRNNNTWGLGASYYRHNYDFAAGKWQKIWLTEFITLEKSGLSQLRQHSPSCNNPNKRFIIGTAAKERSVGQVLFDHVRRSVEHLSQHPVIEVMQKSELVEEALQLSNILVLTYPCLLTLFPIGLFDDARIFQAILYTLAADVLFVLPLIIEGFELVILKTRRSYTGGKVRYHGNEHKDGVQIVQFFPGKSSYFSNVLRTGIFYIVSGFCLMLLGIILEMLSLTSIHERKENRYDDDIGKGLPYYWKEEEEEIEIH